MKIRNYLLSMDILGFKQLSKTMPVDKLDGYLARLFTGTSSAGVSVNRASLRFLGYADTCIVYSTDSDLARSLVEIIQVAHIVQYGQLYASIGGQQVLLPVRGAISFGEFIHRSGAVSTQALGRVPITAQNVQCLIGRPLIEAYESEKQMEIMAIALSQSVVEAASTSLLDSLVQQNLLVWYDVPLKDNQVEKRLLVNPLENVYFDLIRRRIEDGAAEASAEVRPKYDNTLSLFEYIRSNGLFYPRLRN